MKAPHTPSPSRPRAMTGDELTIHPNRLEPTPRRAILSISFLTSPDVVQA
jgi:hypothetical protein